MSDLRSSMSDNEGESLRMPRVYAHQTQRQEARHSEHDRICRRSIFLILERDAFHYSPGIDYCADNSVAIREIGIIYKYCEPLKYTGKST